VYPKVSGLSRNETNNNNRHSFRSNIKDYGGKTRYTDSQNSDTNALSGRGLYHLQFSLQAASPETFGYTLACHYIVCKKKKMQCSSTASIFQSSYSGLIYKLTKSWSCPDMNGAYV
jgi:hypothetical protein